MTATALRERIATSTSSGNLAHQPGTCDADVLMSAAFIARHGPRALVAMAIYRMRLTGDRAEFELVTETAAAWLIRHTAKEGHRGRLSTPSANHIAAHTLDWYLAAGPHHDGAERDPPAAIMAIHVKHMRWLEAEFDGLCGFVMGEFAKRLGHDMELALAPTDHSQTRLQTRYDALESTPSNKGAVAPTDL